MSTALTVYGNQTVSATLGTANQLASTNTGTTTSGISTLIGTAFGTNCWGEFTSNGSAAAWPALAAASAPTGKGWFLDANTLDLQQLIAGNWQWVNRLKVSVGTATIDVMMRAYKYSGGTYSLIGSITLTGTSQTTTITTFTSALTAFASMNFTTGDRLYIDSWGNITANATGSSAATFQMQTCNNLNLGRANNMQMLTAGYQTLVTKSLPVRVLLRAQNTRTLVTRFLLRTQKTLSLPVRLVERVTNTRSLPVRLLVNTTKSLSLPLRTLLNVKVTKTLTVRTILRAMTTRSLPVRALIRVAKSLSLPLRTILNVKITRTLTVRTILRAMVTRSLPIRALVRVQISKTLVIRSIIRNTVTKTLGVRTRLQISNARTLGVRIVLGIPQPLHYSSVTWVTRDGKITWKSRS